jgi:hypothetical protein
VPMWSRHAKLRPPSTRHSSLSSRMPSECILLIAAAAGYYVTLLQGSVHGQSSAAATATCCWRCCCMPGTHLCAAVALPCNASHVWEVRPPLAAVQPVLPPVTHLHALAAAAAAMDSTNGVRTPMNYGPCMHPAAAGNIFMRSALQRASNTTSVRQ